MITFTNKPNIIINRNYRTSNHLYSKANNDNKGINSQDIQSTYAFTYNTIFTGKILKKQNKIIIKNLFKPETQEINIPGNESTKLKPYKISKKLNSDNKLEIKIFDVNNNKILAVASCDSSQIQPQVNLELGNFSPVFLLSDNKVSSSLILTRNSYIKGSGFEIASGEKVNKLLGSEVSFTGKSSTIYFNDTYRREDSREAIKEYFDKELYKYTDRGKYAGVYKNQYSIIGLVGGYGSRLGPLIDIDETNKPALHFPGSIYRLMHFSVLDLANRAGLIDPERIKNDLKTDNYTQFNMNNGITEHKSSNTNIVYITASNNKPLGTGCGIISALREGILPDNKPLIITTGDIFTNIDLSKSIKEFESSNSGTMRVMVPLPSEKAKTFDPFRIKKDNDGNWIIISQNAKKNLENAAIPEGKNEGLYPIASNFSIIHPKMLKILKELANTGEPYEWGDFQNLALRLLNDENFCVSKSDNPKLHEILKRQDLLDEKGKFKGFFDEKERRLKATASLAETSSGEIPFWNDLGTIEGFIDEIKSVADENNVTYKTLPEFFIRALQSVVDLNTGVICMTRRAKNELEYWRKEYGISELEGDIIVTNRKEDSNICPELTPYDIKAIIDTRQAQNEREISTLPTSAISSSERMKLRAKIEAALFDKGVIDKKQLKKDRQVFIVMGLNGSGKSSKLIPTLQEKYGAVLIDNDSIMNMFPEYQQGRGLMLIEQERDDIAKKVLTKTIEDGFNIIKPNCGLSYDHFKNTYKKFKDAGYKVNLRFVYLDPIEAAKRAVKRFENTGIFTDPIIHQLYGDKPLEIYMQLISQEKNLFETYAAFSNKEGKEKPLKLIPQLSNISESEI